MNTRIDDFIKYLRYELRLSAHTVSAYSCDLMQLCTWISDTTGEEFTPELLAPRDIRAWIVQLHDDGISARSVRRKIQSLRAFYKWALRTHIVGADPTESIETVKFEKRLPTWIQPDTMEAILHDDETLPDAVTDDIAYMRNRLIVDILYQTGIRRSELVTLADANVDTRSCEIKVLGKRNKERIVPIGKQLGQDIERYRTMRNRATGESDTLFVLDSGEPLYPNYVYRVVTQMLSGVGVAKRSPHVLRHSFASAMLNDGAEINSVKELLGHSSLAATQVYTHITLGELKESYKLAHPRADKEERRKL